MLPRVKQRRDRVESGAPGIPVLFFGTGSFLRFSLSRCSQCFPMRQPEQVVRRAPQVGHLLDFPAAHVPHFAQPARLLQPAEDLLDFLARLLANLVAKPLHPPQHPSPRLAVSVGGGHALGGDGHIRSDAEIFFDRAQKLSGFVARIAAERFGLEVMPAATRDEECCGG